MQVHSGSESLMRVAACYLLAALLWVPLLARAELGSPGGAQPANVDEIAGLLRSDPYDIELLISFGTSKGGSAGHLALAIRDQAPDDDVVYSANFYADRQPVHEEHFFTDDLMIKIQRWNICTARRRRSVRRLP